MFTTIGVFVTMLAVAVADAAGFAVAVAVMVTVPPGGTVEGAEYVAGLPLAVCGVIVPHAVAPHVTDQPAPSARGSFVTIAVMLLDCAVPTVCT